MKPSGGFFPVQSHQKIPLDWGVREEKEREAGERGEGQGESPSERALCVLRQGDLRPDFCPCTGKMASPTEENGSTGNSAK